MAIHIDKVCKTYDGRTVLSDFSADFPEPGVSCLMGKSGIGKTTLLHILLGLVQQDSGIVSGLEGRKTAAVFQEDRLLPWHTALENVALVIDTAAQKQAEQMLHRVGIGEAMHQPVTELSGGMQRRVAIARALVADAEILILDEPFKGLDNELKLAIMELVRDVCQTKTVILVTHDMSEAKFLRAKVFTL